MPVIYALVARAQNVLAECTEGTGNFITYSRAILRDVDDHKYPPETRNSVAVDGHVFYYYLSDSLIYVCMCDERFQSSVAYALLTEIKHEFLSNYGNKGKTANAYAMKGFETHLKGLMTKYDNVKIDTKLTQVRDQVKHVKNQMLDNLHQIMARGDKLEVLVSKTEKLQQDTLAYEGEIKALHRLFWLKNLKATLTLVFLVAILMWLVSSWICGFDFSKCSSANIQKQVDAQGAKINLPFTSAP
ncbi:hypothetical protein SDRG_04370 [Saprolegnia diclina VS20]|uniref:Vesicle-associated membrane protein 7 n=1 Tax=Saprolegnia diclina (strain VS20) TaxID=1156394 RepID=T0QKU6_SAPDV|nr:hypothetical protein SDRG_04370 [Saprolegnia diclina VS20]EQC38674.1 hypothetical protein SDRG_04370 [Saprolegnia diclina VS20]|eukprot:XP_008608266.1 hypothetical protein SDRG_04370 [Saprolegnia diclina VS20]